MKIIISILLFGIFAFKVNSQCIANDAHDEISFIKIENGIEYFKTNYNFIEPLEIISFKQEDVKKLNF